MEILKKDINVKRIYFLSDIHIKNDYLCFWYKCVGWYHAKFFTQLSPINMRKS